MEQLTEFIKNKYSEEVIFDNFRIYKNILYYKVVSVYVPTFFYLDDSWFLYMNKTNINGIKKILPHIKNTNFYFASEHHYLNIANHNIYDEFSHYQYFDDIYNFFFLYKPLFLFKKHNIDFHAIVIKFVLETNANDVYKKFLEKGFDRCADQVRYLYGLGYQKYKNKKLQPEYDIHGDDLLAEFKIMERNMKFKAILDA